MASTDRLGHRTRGRENAFDVLRLLGATLVLVSHSYALLGFVEPRLGHSSFGAIGVEIFFAISGFLIAASWISEPRIRAFLVKRALRILPALFVTVMLSAFLLGPLLTTVSPGSYFSSSMPLRYVVENMASVVTGGAALNVNYALPGVFANLPSDAVNGSLWTLPVEVRAYFIVLALGLLGILLRWLWVPVLAGLAFLVVGGSETTLLLVLFLVSSLLYVHRDRVPLHRHLALAAVAVWIAGTWIEHGGALIALAIPYLVLYVAYRAPAAVRVLTRRGDVSYGLYLLAFPVQQIAVHLLPGMTPLELIAVSLPATYLLATLSWHLVERPALRLKGALTSPSPRRAASLPRLEPQPAESR
jgi:peptidoglycan/LPS O-acetylase OafA/YrhL